MRRRIFCRRLGLMPFVVSTSAAFDVFGQAAAAIPTLAAERTIEVAPNDDNAEPPVLTAVAIHPGGRTLAAAGDDHLVRMWNIADGRLIAEWAEHTDWVRSIAFSPSGKELLTAGDDHTLVLWDVATGKILRRDTNPGGVLHKVAYLPDGKRYLTAGFDARVRIFDAAGGGLVQELSSASDDIRGLTVSPNGERLSTAGRDGVIRIWNLVDYKPVAEVPAHRMRVRVLTYSPDGGRLLSAGDDRKFFLWKEDGSREATLPAPPGRLMAAAFLGQDRVAVGGSDNLIRILDLTTRRELQYLAGHTGSIAALDFQAESGLLVSSSFDTSAKLWKPASDARPARVTSVPSDKTKK
jgi:WD40 repeat protein